MGINSGIRKKAETVGRFHSTLIESKHKCKCKGDLLLTRKYGVEEFFVCTKCGDIHKHNGYTLRWDVIGHNPIYPVKGKKRKVGSTGRVVVIQ